MVLVVRLSFRLVVLAVRLTVRFAVRLVVGLMVLAAPLTALLTVPLPFVLLLYRGSRSFWLTIHATCASRRLEVKLNAVPFFSLCARRS